MARRPLATNEPIVETIPILPVRDTVHFPGLVNTVLIIRERSQRAIRAALEAGRQLIVLSQRDHSIEEPEGSDLFEIGTISEVLQSVPMPDGSQRVVLRGLRRVVAENIHVSRGMFVAHMVERSETSAEGVEIEALMRSVERQFTRVVEHNTEIPPEALHGLQHLDDPTALADTIAHHLPVRAALKQELLAEFDARRRLERLVELLAREEQVIDADRHIQERVRVEIGNSQREFFLREQLRSIEKELRDKFGVAGEGDDLALRIASAPLPETARTRAKQELARLERMASGAQESALIRDYIELLLALPWSVRTSDSVDLAAASRLLDQRHFGLDAAKQRILDFLAVHKLRAESARGAIICLVGPPGVGKTSLGRAIADALGRQYARVALGGVRDEAEIRGHRRAYLGASPGRLVQALREAGSMNPMMLLDEIDKLATDGHGDPASALLEALDPEQNDRFVDHFVETPIDLSQVMFVATANTIDFIPSALRDRMEIIPIAGYTERERDRIATDHLWPFKLAANGLNVDRVALDDDVIPTIVRDYTKEAGVRGLGRALDALARKVARRVAEGDPIPVHVEGADLKRWLGPPTPKSDIEVGADQIGVVKGLVVSELGGDVIEIEVCALKPVGPTPQLVLTGNLGKIMQESAEAAWSCVRSTFPAVAFTKDVHVHVPDGAIPKDGPSAGIAIATAIASAMLERPVRGLVAMTGEISLRGRVLGIGGLREKALAAERYGVTDVIVPRANAHDVETLAGEISDRLRIHQVERFGEVIELALAAA